MSTTTTMTSESGTVITAEPNGQVIEITRDFDAPPERVFAAFTDSDLFAQWVGPESIDTAVEHWDARTGGAWRYLSTRGAESFGFHGSFHEVDPPRTLTQTFEFEGIPGHVALERMDLEPLDGGSRTRLRQRSVFQTVEDRDGMLQSGMEEGVFEGFEALDRILAGS